MNFNSGFAPVHSIQDKIQFLKSPCCIQEDKLNIQIYESSRSLLNFWYSSKKDLFISIFVNFTEIENISNNLTKKITLTKENSDEIHQKLKAFTNKLISIKLLLSIKDFQNIYIPKNINKDKYVLLIWLEPIDFSHRFVNMYYYDLDKSDSEQINFKLVKQKMEIRNQAYLIYDIYGMEKFQSKRIDSDALQDLCNICLDESINVIILPCRHMALCIECAKIYNTKDEVGEYKMKFECPVCREGITSFVYLKNLDELQNN